jgi:hypothetical protein
MSDDHGLEFTLGRNLISFVQINSIYSNLFELLALLIYLKLFELLAPIKGQLLAYTY